MIWPANLFESSKIQFCLFRFIFKEVVCRIRDSIFEYVTAIHRGLFGIKNVRSDLKKKTPKLYKKKFKNPIIYIYILQYFFAIFWIKEMGQLSAIVQFFLCLMIYDMRHGHT